MANTEPAAGELDAVSDRLMDAVGRLSRELRRELRRRLPGSPLTSTQIELLAVLHSRPLLRVGEVAQAMQVAPNTASTLVAQLVADGYVSRSGDLTDRRLARLALTEKAHDALDRWLACRRQVATGALGRLDDIDRARIEAALPAFEGLLAALLDRSGRGEQMRVHQPE